MSTHYQNARAALEEAAKGNDPNAAAAKRALAAMTSTVRASGPVRSRLRVASEREIIDRLRREEGIDDPLREAYAERARRDAARATRAADSAEMDARMGTRADRPAVRREGSRLVFDAAGTTNPTPPASKRVPAAAPAPKRRPTPRDPAREAQLAAMDDAMGLRSDPDRPAVRREGRSLVFDVTALPEPKRSKRPVLFGTWVGVGAADWPTTTPPPPPPTQPTTDDGHDDETQQPQHQGDRP